MKVRAIIKSELVRRLLTLLGAGGTHLLPESAPHAGGTRLLPSIPFDIGMAHLWPAPSSGASRAYPVFAPPPSNSRAHVLPSAQSLLGPIGITLVLWFTSPHHISIVQLLSSFLLLVFPWWSYRHWQAGRRGLPLFSAVAAMYWLYFSVQLFWGDRAAMDWHRATRQVGDAAIAESMVLVVLGVVCLGFGIKSGFGRRIAPKRFPDIFWKPLTLFYVLGIAAIGTLMSSYGSFTAAGEEGSRQIVAIIEGTVSSTAVLILLRRTMDHKAGKFEKKLLILILGSRILLGVSSGWMGTAAALGVSCAFVYMHKYRKFPIVILACVLPYLLFFQAGKQQFRNVFWSRQMQAGTIERAEFWVDASLKAWRAALDDPSGSTATTLLSSSLSRTSLLTQAANVLEQTPSIVPYQYGRLYSYIVVGLVPRLLWPDKPSMNEANQFYQVAYGVTREQDLNTVSVAVGSLTEGYINFSWFGTALVMFLIGVLLDFWNETFLVGGGTSLAVAIGIAVVPQLLMVESQMAQYLSGLIQHVILTIAIFAPITRWRRNAAIKPMSGEALGKQPAQPERAFRPA